MVRKTASRVERACRERGIKMTVQRRVIADVLSAADDHPDVQELHRRANKIDKRISLATVYRTVRLFEEEGILERHEFGDGLARYEESSEEHHDHLINVRSGEIIEFHNERIEALQEEIAAAHGLRLVGHRMELFGVPMKPAAAGKSAKKGTS